jgi:hypothetical protein
MHTGQNSTVPESSLPQIEQMRWGSVLMDLTVLQPQSEPKATPRPSSGVKSSSGIRWRIMVRLQSRGSVFSKGYQIPARIKIRDFEAQDSGMA